MRFLLLMVGPMMNVLFSIYLFFCLLGEKGGIGNNEKVRGKKVIMLVLVVVLKNFMKN